VTRTRVAIFVAVCVVCIAAGIVTIARSTPPGSAEMVVAGSTGGPPPAASVEAVADRPHLLYRSTRLGPDFGKLSLVALDDPGGPVATTDLSCERVDFQVDRGVCLAVKRGAVTTYATVVFDEQFRVVHETALAGLPSRVRVSPDGRLGATTSFVSGDSYAPGTFSTRTELLDLRTGESFGALEQFRAFRDGDAFESVDFNYWGITFARDGRTFYATLGTGGHTYLVEGDVEERTVTVLRDGVECPMLSPDGRRIAFKKRVPEESGRLAWRLSVLDLDTLEDHELAEPANIDDQANWLDADTVIYALPVADSGSPTFDTWRVPADGSGAPERLLSGAWSTAVVG
jgi:hypothetical protein